MTKEIHKQTNVFSIMKIQIIRHLFECSRIASTKATEVNNVIGTHIQMDPQLPSEEIIEALREALHPFFFSTQKSLPELLEPIAFLKII